MKTPVRTRISFAGTLRQDARLQILVTSLLLPGLVVWTGPVQANPQGGNIIHGDVHIGAGTGGNLQILQNSSNAIINWDSFSIAAGELTQFKQPGSNAAVLNRVTGGDPSAIHGALKANGNVFVINPNGILVGPSGTIDVHGLVLSTLDVDDGEFLAGGDMTFRGVGENVTNMGRINGIGGDVFLIGRTVTNSGSIRASSGTVGLAAGEEVLLTAKGNKGERLFVRAKGSGVSGTGILNDGTIEGAAVELKAHGNMYALAINNKGSIRATGAVNAGGKVYLRGAGGGVSNSGTIRASGPAVGSGGRVLIEAAYAKVDGMMRAEGGHVRITGTDKVELGGSIDVTTPLGRGGDVVVEGREIEVGNTAVVDASGASGGGNVRIGGGFQGRDADIQNADRVVIGDGAVLRADATESGGGGNVIVWSDGDTMFRGHASAEGIHGGGFVEISGRERLGFHGTASTLAADGTAGTLLLDPTDGTVSAAVDDPGGSPFNINNDTLATALGSNHVVLSTPSGGTDSGHVTFQDAVMWNSDFSLTTLAHGDVVFDASVQNAGTGGLHVVAGWSGNFFPGGTPPMASPGSVDIAAFLSAPSSYGNGGGEVQVGSGGQSDGIAVGSRGGATTLLGHGIHLLGGGAGGYAQVGYRPTGASQATSGNLVLRTHGGGLSVLGGSGAGAFAQVGHGGFGSTANTLGGGIDALSTVASDLLLTAGSANNAYAQIGHGGEAVKTSTKSGAITLEAFRDVTVTGGSGAALNAYAQIGHGGRDADGAVSGAISLLDLTGNVALHGGSSSALGAYSQIGHGGRDHSGARSGAITLTTTGGGVGLTGGVAGAGGDAYALIGHGGRNIAGNASGAISVTASGDIRLTAGQGTGGAERWAQIGHGGIAATGSGNYSDRIDVVSSGGDVTLQGGATQNASAQIGHGGRNTTGDHTGAIRVTAAGSVLGTAGTSGTRTGVMIGHGGSNAANSATAAGNDGAIAVTAESGSIIFRAGGTESWAQIGHGGNLNVGDHSGTITAKAEQGGVEFYAGTGVGAYAHLGHGGTGAVGSHGGGIEVTALNNILFQAGIGTDTYAQLGHGGYGASGNHGDSIRVQSLAGGVDFRWAATSTTPGNRAYAHLGHGGGNAAGHHSGDIVVLAHANILFQNSTSATAGRTFNYVQLGHGGANAAGDHSGNITVLSDTGTLSFRSGTRGDGDRYAQLGHGGTNAAGTHSGDIAVLAHGNLTFSTLGGTSSGFRSYAQLGHGGYNADSPAGHGGRIGVASRTGSIVFLAAPHHSEASYVQLGHGGYDAAGDHHGDIVVRSGNSFTFDGGIGTESGGFGNYAQLGHGGMRAEGSTDPDSNLSGNITASSNLTGDFSDIGDFDGDGIFDTSVMSMGTSGTGLRFQAGANAAAVDNYAQLGHGGRGHTGSHGGIGETISVSSGRSISFLGGAGVRSYAQLGHGGAGAISPNGHSGDIFVQSVDHGATSSLLFTPGRGLESYAQLGHGGLGATGNHSGSIRAFARNAVTFNANSGTILDGYRAYAQLGHGGYGALGDHLGNITVQAHTSTITFTGGNAADARGEGEEDERYAQLGHGGAGAAGNHSGDIAVLSQGNINFTRGANATGSYVQVGHGGRGAVATSGHTGRIGVATRGGSLIFTGMGSTGNIASASYAQLGHGGHGAGATAGGHGGDIVVRAMNHLEFRSHVMESAGAYSQLGHGGMLAAGNYFGNITVSSQIAGDYLDIGDFDGNGLLDDVVTVGQGTSAEGLLFFAGYNNGPADDAYAQLGHGGRLARGSHSGDITVDSLRQIRFVGGQVGARGYAQLGHGGSDAGISGGAAGTTGNSGDIMVASRTGVVDFRWTGVDTPSGDGAYLQLGHGGYISDGIAAGSDHSGDIRVTSGTNLLFRSTTGGSTAVGTESEGNYVQLGHGGLRWNGDHTGDISARAGAGGASGTLTFTAGDSAAGNSDGVSDGSTDRYAQLGHGGGLSRGSHSGDIEVLSYGNIAFTAGRNPRSYAQIGHGGHDADDPDGSGRGNSGTIRVGSQTGNINFLYSSISTSTSSATGTPGLGSYAQIGHGGYNTTGPNTGDIFVRAGGNLLFRGARGNFLVNGVSMTGNYVQIGHGGFQAEGDQSGSITVGAGIGGAFSDLFDLDGDGTLDEVDVTSNGTGTIEFLSGSGGADRYAQLGHGGRLARGDHGAVDGDGNALDTLSVTALGDIVFTAWGSTRNYAQLGNGGHDADLAANPRGAAANIEVVSTTGSVRFSGSTGDSGYAHLGNGGYTTSGNHRGDILVEAARDVIFSGAQSLTSTTGNAYVQLGHGGRTATGNHSGDITVRAGLGGDAGAVRFLAGRATDRYAQLGHGGRSASGNHDGGIEVEAWGDIEFSGGDFRYYSISSPDAAAAAIAGGGSGGRLNSNTTTGRLSLIQAGTLVLNLSDPVDAKYATIVDDGRGKLLDGDGTVVGSVNYANSTVTFDVAVANAGSTLIPQVYEFNFSYAYAHLGHGGYSASSTTGNHGDIKVAAGLGGTEGHVAFTAGVGNGGYTMLGHGGLVAVGDHVGDIRVDALGDIRFRGNQGVNTFAQMGHGGYSSSLTSTSNVGNSGDIFVNTRTALVNHAGGIYFTGGSGRRAHVQIGHGGYQTRGIHTGNLAGENVIEVRAADDIVFVSGDGSGYGTDTVSQYGNGRLSYAQIGHGGYDSDAAWTGGVDGDGHFADIVVRSGGELRFVASDLAMAPIANDNYRNYAQLGHGGHSSSGDHRGNITVEALGGVTFQGGGFLEGDNGFTTQSLYAQLGHGGRSATGYGSSTTPANSGAITVRAGVNAAGAVLNPNADIVFLAGGTGDAYAQMGHGGYSVSGGQSGEIRVDAGGDLRFHAGSHNRAYAMVGHGGHSASGQHGTAPGQSTADNRDGDITVRAGGIVEFLSGAGLDFTGTQQFSQLGHGGYSSTGSHRGHILVTAGTGERSVPGSGVLGGSGEWAGIVFTAGGGQDTYTLLGHGGRSTKGGAADSDGRAFSGDITVDSQSGVHFTAGTRWNNTATGTGTLNDDGRNFAMLGHGGYDADVSNSNTYDPAAGYGHNGAIQVTAHSGDIVFLAGGATHDGMGGHGQGYGRFHWAQLGHGGYAAHGDHHGGITTEALDGNIVFTGGASIDNDSSRYNYALLGHGGGGGSSTSTSTSAYHGHHGRADDVIRVVAQGDPSASKGGILFTGGANNVSFAQIGNGGYLMFGDKSGAIEVVADANITFTGGATSTTFAQIGHGGREVVGNHTGSIQVESRHGNILFTGGSAGASNVQIGFGGYGSVGNHSGDITVEAKEGGITFLAGNTTTTAEIYAQLGHGGRIARGDHSGNITVFSHDDIVFTGGSGAQSYAQLGHGGYDSDNPNPGGHGYATDPGAPDGPPGFPSAEERVGNEGNITVRAGVDASGNVLNADASISFSSGNANHTYAQLGHGGGATDGDHMGDIKVEAGRDIVFDALYDAALAAGSHRYVQLGHGGYLVSGGHVGHIEVAAGGALDFRAGRSNAYAQIGHGGRNDSRLSSATAYANLRFYPGTHSGGIEVRADGDIRFQGSVGTGGSTGYAQIGHGGYRNAAVLDEGHNGSISVLSGGLVDFRAGTQTGTYAQIGHGGYEAFGNHGRLTVHAETGAALDAASQAGGPASLEYADLLPGSVLVTVGSALYHDDGVGGLRDSSGAVVGSISYATGGIEFLSGVNTAGDAVAVRYHHGGSDILVQARDGVEFAGGGTVTGGGTQTYAVIGHGGYDADLQVRTRRALGQAGTSSNYHLNTPVLPTGSAAGLHGGTSGDITVLAGVDAAGNVLNPDAAIVFTAGPATAAYVQIGSGGRSTSGSHQGDIAVRAASDIEFTAGRLLTEAYARLGHGGHLSNVSGLAGFVGGHRGDIDVASGLGGGASGGMAFLAGTGAYNYVQIGHGGSSTSSTNTSTSFGSHRGNIGVSAGIFGAGHAEAGRGIVFRSGNDNRAYSQLGHGGSDALTNGFGDGAVGLKGDIHVAAVGDILFVAGTVGGKGLWNTTDGIAYTLLGHGGYNADVGYDRSPSSTNPVYGRTDIEGDPVGHGGDITVISGGSVEFLGGDANRAYEPSTGDNDGRIHFAQLGHGGYSSVGNHWGAITVRAGMDSNRNVTNPDARVYFAAGGPTADRTGDTGNYAQLGHGGRAAAGNHGLRDADGNPLETISVWSGGDITFTAEAGALNSYVMLGHGGYQGRGDHAALIDVFAEKDIRFTAGMLPYAPAPGEGAYTHFSYAGTTTSDSTIRARSLDWAANLHADGSPAPPNGVLGRVNLSPSRVVDGSIVVTIRDTALNVIGRLVQVGNHLVAEADITADFGTGAGVETIFKDEIVANVGNGSSGEGVSATGTTHLTFLRDVNPGASASTANLAVEFEHGAGDRSFALLGHGGYDSDQPDGNAALGNTGKIEVTSRSGNIAFSGGTQTITFAQLGHGGNLTQGAQSGDIEVRALDGGIEFTAGSQATAYTQLGHGGREANGDHRGRIVAEALGGGIRFTAGNANTTAEIYAQLGHGGRSARGDLSGDIEVISLDDILFTGGRGAQNYAQLGHGGYDSDNPNPSYYPDNDPDNPDRGPTAAERVGNSGDITVTSLNGGLFFTSGNANHTYTQLGHGGSITDGDHTGDIVVKAAGEIRFDATGSVGGAPPAGTYHYAQIGHGGYAASGGHTGDVIVEAGGAIVFTGGPTSWVQLGHGGRNDHRLSTSSPYNNNNDRYYPGTHRGNILVDAGGDVFFDGYQYSASVGGGTGSGGYAQIGHGGFRNAAIYGEGHSGDIDVLSGGLLRFRAGPRSQAYAQIGHGGFEAFGDHGRLTVHAETVGTGDDVTLANPGLAAGSVRVTIGAAVYHDDGLGGLRDATGAVVASVDYGTGEIIFNAGVNSGVDPAVVFYQHGRSDIFVQARDGVSFASDPTVTSSADQAYAQIGHGGYDADFAARTVQAEGLGISGTRHHLNTPVGTPGGTSGNITVLAGVDASGAVLNPTAAITFTAGGEDDAYAQLGNGGRANSGSHQGDIVVKAASEIRFEAGNLQPEAYAQLGHGGLGASSPGLAVGPDGTTTITIGHRGDISVAAGLGGASGGIGFFAGSANATGDNYAQLGHGGRSATGNHRGDIDVAAWGSILFQGGGYRSLTDTSSTGLTTAAESGGSGQFVTTANIRPGHLVIRVADPVTPAYATLIDDGEGRILDGEGGVVGGISYFTATVTFNAPVSEPGGTVTADYDHFNFSRGYVHLGHGGSSASANQGHGGDISVMAGLGGVEGDIDFHAGMSTDAYAQLGMGGSSATGDHFGDIRVDALGDIRFTGEWNLRTYAQLGNGGYNADLNTTSTNNPWGENSVAIGNRGDIFVNTRFGLAGGPLDSLVNTGGIHFTAGGGKESYTQLGHGGYGNRGANAGDIDVRGAGDIVFHSGDASGRGDDTATQFGNGRRAYGQLGHGGYDSDAHNVDADGYDGLGHVGGIQVISSGGAIRFASATIVSAPSGAVAGPIANDFRNYVQLGHGGLAASGDHAGDIMVSAQTGIEFRSGGIEAAATANTSQDNYAQLGHGGYSAAGYGTGTLAFSGKIVAATAAGDIRFAGGNSNDGYVQLGHGGRIASNTLYRGDITGDIEVVAEAGSIVFTSGNRTYHFAQLGHGGASLSSSGSVPNAGNNSGSITVKALGGEIRFEAGTAGSETYTQLGHGGRSSRGDHSGDIEVISRDDIVFTGGGTGAQAYAHLGHGGYDTDNPNGTLDPVNGSGTSTYYPDNDPLNPDRGPTAEQRVGNSGAITVESLDGSLLFTTGSANNSYTQLGHGGSQTDGDHSGDIVVHADRDGSNAAGGGGNIVFLANTAGSAHFAQIGHGGYRASGGNTGSITVEAGAAIAFTGGGTSSYVQIGHGGRNDHRITRSGSSPNYTQNNDSDRYYPGSHSGAVSVRAAGDIAFASGTGTGAFGQIGHGGYRNAAEAGEGHSGAIEVVGGGEIRFFAGTGSTTYAQIGHGGYEAFGNHGHVVVRAEVDAAIGAASQGGSAFLANASLAPGSVRVTVDPDGIGAGRAIFVDDGAGNLIDPDDVLGAGAGAVVGTVDYASGEVVFVENVNTAGDAVSVAYLHGGSEILVDGGTGVVFAGGASSAYAQIGHGGVNSTFSSTRVVQPEEPSPASYTSTTTYHLNTPLADPLGHSGGITVRVGTGETLDGNAALAFSTGNGNDSYAQIGHGGRTARGDHRGDILVDVAGDIRFESFLGDPVTQVQTSATLDARLVDPGSGGTYTLSQTGNLERGGNFTITYDNPLPGFSGVIVGDGVGGLFDSVSGQPVGAITTGGGITFTVAVSSGTPAASVSYQHFNTGLRSYAQIGHGGNDADFTSSTTPGNTGDVTVRSHHGEIGFRAGSRSESYAQIGHGGVGTNGNHVGDILVESLQGGVSFAGGIRGDAYAQLGHGGRSSLGNFSGDITVNASGDIAFSGGNFRSVASTSAPAVLAAAILGNGTAGLKLPTTANIRPGAVVIELSGPLSPEYATITDDGEGNLLDGNGVVVGAINYANADVTFLAPVAAPGSSASASYDEFNFSRVYAQLGHGGSAAAATIGHTGDIRVAAGLGGVAGDIRFTAGVGSDSYTQLGHGGGNSSTGTGAAGDHRGDIWVDALDDIRFRGNQGAQTYAQLGHGGHLAGLNSLADAHPLGYDSRLVGNSGDIFVNTRSSLVANTGGIHFLGGGGRRAYAQLGHGGWTTRGAHSGNLLGQNVIEVRAVGDIEFRSGDGSGYGTDTANQFGNGRQAYAQLGHGGYDSDSSNSSTAAYDGLGHRANIVVVAGGEVSFVASDLAVAPIANDTYRNYAQLGHGGLAANGDHGGDIRVSADGGVTFQGGSFLAGDGGFPLQSLYAQLGHGGYSASGYSDVDGDTDTSASTGDIRVVSGAHVLFHAGSSNRAYAQMGHGGYGARGNHGGDILVRAQGDVGFASGSADRAYSQLGHGGYDADIPDGNTATGNWGDIFVASTGGGLSFLAGDVTNAYTLLGHGGTATRGGNTGHIVARAGGDVLLRAGAATQAYSHIGHGGYDADGNHSGDVIVSAGSGALDTVLGTGVFDDLGDADGDGIPDAIQFAAVAPGEGRVDLIGGSVGNAAYAMIGHGGYASGNTNGSVGGIDGRVGVAAYGGILLQGGDFTNAFAQIGHGGYESGTLVWDLGGDISVISQTGRLDLLAGTDTDSYALVGHGALRNTVSNVPTGSRSGDIYVEAGSWNIVPGTNIQARIGHRSQAVNNGLTAGNQFTLIGNGADGTSSYLIDAAAVALMGVQDHLAGGGGATFAAFGDLVLDLPLVTHSANDLNVLATGDLTILRHIQNSGSGDVTAVAGWDGLTPSLDFLDKVPMRDVDAAAISTDPAAWGNHGGVLRIGGGNQSIGVAVGSAGGTTTVLGDAVEVIASHTTVSGLAQIGFFHAGGSNPGGDIRVAAREGGVSVLAGSLTNTSAQIGHRSLGAFASTLAGTITLASGGDLTIAGGGGLQSFAHVGHGGPGVVVTGMGGAIIVTVADDISLSGGTGAVAYSQIGHGGSSAKGTITGDTDVSAGGSITMSAGNLANLSYAKIGHGDDSRAATPSQTGTGARSGGIQVAAGSDIHLTGAMIGHVNSLSPASATGGVTQIGVSRDDPSDAGGGELVADAASQFHGEDELRFYLPRRGNNRIAAGAMLNGTLWNPSPDPSPVQRVDEYTIHILGVPDASLDATPNEHGNVFGTGPVPGHPAGFAFYYDTIRMGPAPFVPVPPGSGSPQTGGSSPLPQSQSSSDPIAPDFPSYLPDDRTTDDWQREQEGNYSGPGESNFYYEGFDQYGFHGESTFGVGGNGDGLDGTLDDEELMRRHLRMLEILGLLSGEAGE